MDHRVQTKVWIDVICEHCTGAGFVCDCFLFSFEAVDEMDPVSGAGTMMLRGERLGFSLLFHFGDEFTFECVLRD